MAGTTIEPTSDHTHARAIPKHSTRSPRVTLLYHVDVSRVGGVTLPSLFADEEWVEYGRQAPEFLAPTENITPGALDDAHISRSQFRLRWLLGSFELYPVGRRPMSLIEFNLQGEPVTKPLPRNATVRLRPGALVAIGNRALLRLDEVVWADPDEERLGMVGESELLWEVRRTIHQVVEFDKPALVLGPTGAGKELVARALHNLSPNAQGPFVPINCAALPELLVESLLFGHKKGAFTGATEDLDGAFVQADKGTLFMDEVGELPLKIQAKLLRVLQEQKVTPVGSHQGRAVDVRLITATNRDLKVELDAGKLREDFYYRVAVHPIQLPSLAMRIMDVPLLFTHFLQMNTAERPRLAWLWAEHSVPEPPIPMSFFIDMLCYNWPGNIRELQNLVAQVCRLNLGGEIFNAPKLSPKRVVALAVAPEGVPSPTLTQNPLSEANQRRVLSRLGLTRKTIAHLMPEGLPPQGSKESFDAYVTALKHLLTYALLDVFETHKFNQVHVARHLKISRNTLIRLMKLFRIPRTLELDTEALERARNETGGDLKAMAEYLNISSRALKLFLHYCASEPGSGSDPSSDG